MRLRKRMMKKASDVNKVDLVNKIYEENKEKVNGIAEKKLNEELQKIGMEVEIDFAINYEYIPEEDGELMEIDIDKTKIKQIEIKDGSAFYEHFNYFKWLGNLGEEYFSRKNENDINGEEFFEDIDLDGGFLFEGFKITQNKGTFVNCKISDSLKLELIDGSEYKKYGISKEINEYVKRELANKIENDIDKSLEGLIANEIEELIKDYSPLKELK